MESEVKYIGKDQWVYSANGRCANEYVQKIADARKEERRIWSKWSGLGFSIFDIAKNWRLNNVDDIDFKLEIMREIDDAMERQRMIDEQAKKEDDERIKLEATIIVKEKLMSKPIIVVNNDSTYK